MKKKLMLSLLLAMLCLLSSCAKTASDEEAFGSDPSAGKPLTQPVEPSEEVAPSEALPPEDEGPETSEPGAADPVQEPSSTLPEGMAPLFVDEVEVEEARLSEEVVPLTSAPAAVPLVLSPVASGTAVADKNGAQIDYSNVKDGYVMARFAGTNDKRLRVQVVGPTTTYTYELPTGNWVTMPLSDGNGSYKVTVFQNTTGKKYAALTCASFDAQMTDQFAPFLRPNQYVNYEGAEETIKKAAELTKDMTDPLKKVEAVYGFVVRTLSYDRDRASAVAKGTLTGYLPNLDSVLAEKKGICFDYAALMTGMLRSQGVPCKLVVGYAGSTYHAWVSVWTEQTGWVDGAIFFDGTTWHRMDPTFASSSNSSEQIMKFIGEGSNYTVKYLY